MTLRIGFACLALAACTPASRPIAPEAPAATAERPAPDAPLPVHFAPGPLAVEPPLPVHVDGWPGMSLFENLISFGFTADGKLFANCHPGNGLHKTCDLLDADHHVARTVSSSVDYGDSHPSKDDPEIAKQLAPLGVPAPEGEFRYAEDLLVSWTAPSDKELRFFLREKTTGVQTPIATFESEMRLAPHRVVVSPDGHRLAIVVYVVGGPPLTTDAQLVDADAAASAAYESAARTAEGSAAAQRLHARARAAAR
jgi:hypothetical protein